MIYALAALLIALNVADWWTTRRVIVDLGGVEKNPAMDWVIQRWGFTGLAWAKVLLVGIPTALVLFVYPGAWWALAMLCALYAYIVWHNVRVIRRLSK